MTTTLVHFQTTDHLRLPGLLFEPEKQTKKVAIYLHGNGTSSIFYSKLTPILGKHLTDADIAYFPFNNRGAHLIKSFRVPSEDGDKRIMYGTAYELIKDCIIDIDSAINELKKRGYTEFYLIGESTGANKIVVYDHYQKQNPVSKYILLSGGDDTGITYNELGKENFFQAIAEAKECIEQGKGTDLVPEFMSPYPYSYQALYDVINPDGDYNIFPYNEYFNDLNLSNKILFREFKTIAKPTLVVYGEHDEFCYGDVPKCIEALKKNTSNTELFTYEIIPDADHGFSGHEEELAKMIARWI
ncbi:hypothetical protein BH09PAT2_BH09PAT2_07360 [soil metagenome]